MREDWDKILFTDSVVKERKTKKINKKLYLEDGKLPIVAQGDNLIEGYWNKQDDVYKIDKPVVIFGDHTKNIKFVDFDFVRGADGVKILVPKNGINSRFFYYQLKNIDLRDLGYARHFRLLKKKNILVPPLPEQKRIVAILDEAFEAIDQAKANIERNIANAEELFQSKLNEIFSQRGKGWKEKKLGELTYVKSGGTPRRSEKEYWENGSIPWYSSGELNELFTTKSERLITKKGLEESNAKLFPKGSLLIGMYDTAALKMSILDRDGAFNQAISGVKPSDGLNLQFVFHAINAIKPELMKLRRGVRQKNLNLTKIKEISIPFPKIEIQNEVVVQLSDLQSYKKSLTETYQTKMKGLEELKKSILQKAFSGELTANEEVAA